MTAPAKPAAASAKPEPNLRPLDPASQRALVDDLRTIADQLAEPRPADSH